MTDLISYIQSLTAEAAIIIVTETEVKMNKKDVETKKNPNHYIGAIKKSTQIVKVNPDYQREVNDQREQEGKDADFEASSRKWGVSLGNGILEKNDKIYVSYIPVKTIESSYEFNGEAIEYSELKKFIPEKKSSGNQGIENEVQFRVISLENIKSFKA
jgi:hypothetical protein